ncbi:MAG: hypothetical protein M1840_001941 [Geoglossum simile]|nr:MAG: hypothetical protein M1840_001941 [Geoglossum simile]
MSSKDRSPAVAHFKRIPNIAQKQSDIRQPPSYCPPLPYLPTYSGFACCHCDTGLTVARSMTTHLSKVHDIHCQYKLHYRSATLQTWYNHGHNLQCLWIVNTSSQLVNTSSQLVNTSSQLVNTSSPLINIPSQLVNTSSQLVNIPSQLVNTSSQLVNTPSQLVNQQSVPTTLPVPLKSAIPLDTTDDMLDDMLEENEELLVEELDGDHYTATKGYTWHDSNVWLKRVQWQEVFNGRPTEIIIATYKLPSRTPDTYRIGHYNNNDLVSPRANEKRIAVILEAFRQLIDRCLNTVDKTSSQIRCWWQSIVRHSPYRAPFSRLQNKASIQKYIAYWCRMLTYILRLFNLTEDIRDRVYGIRYQEKDLQHLQQIWDSTTPPISDSRHATYDPDTDYNNNCAKALSHTKQTEELLLLFWATVLTEHFDDGTSTRNLLIHFSNVLGLQAHASCFRNSKDYTPYLAPLIYFGKLILLEYALPVQLYTFIDLPVRDTYQSQVQRMHSIQSPYLIRGNFHPIPELIERLKFGRVIANNMGAKPTMQWSDNKEILHYLDSKVSMHDFKSWVKTCIDGTKQQLQELMFGYIPNIDLSKVAESMSMDKRSFYFALHPENVKKDMVGWYKQLIPKCKEPGPYQMHRDGEWLPGAIDNYISKRDTFLQHLMLCMHLTGGLPARSPEISTIKYRNSDTLRNIMFYKGLLASTIRYHKAQTSHNHEFYVARFYPDCVTQLLFLYLVYIRPFTSSLVRRIAGNDGLQQVEHLLFCDAKTPHIPWKSRVLTNILKSTSIQYFSDIQFGIANYRQVVVGIADTLLKDKVKMFDLKNTYQDIVHTTMTWQTGHSLAIRQGNYAAQMEYPVNLQPRLLEQYFAISTAWHRWLGIAKTIKKMDIVQRVETPRISSLKMTPVSPIRTVGTTNPNTQIYTRLPTLSTSSSPIIEAKKRKARKLSIEPEERETKRAKICNRKFAYVLISR